VSCAYDPDESGVELRSIDPNTTVRLWNRVTPYDDDIVGICVELLADDVRGALHDITLLQATGGLSIYLLELAEEFRGWTGVWSWEAPDHDLRIDAEYIRSGYVDLTWTITPWRGVAGRWSVSVKSTIQAGEDLRQLALRVNRFVHPDNQ
jgi:hypothetical protein